MNSSTTLPDFEKSLNEQQYRAAKFLDGPLLVIAGAGSGKTRTLVYRVAMLILQGIPPESILLLTFTRKAAANMLQRAARITGMECSQVDGGTFHAFAHRMLRSHAHLAGYPHDFTIMDSADSRDLIGLLISESGVSGRSGRFPKKTTVMSLISKARNGMRSIDDTIRRYYSHLMPEAQGIGMIAEAYQAYKKKHALMDYDDLLLLWRDILVDNHEVRTVMGQRYQFIMVDEYQDTNPAQAEIVRLMATGHDNVMVVGDDAQSIYSFRGATIDNIRQFPSLFHGTTIIKLEKNYRTTQPNLDCANAIMASGDNQFAKKLTAFRSGGSPPVLYKARDENDQGRYVAGMIWELIDKGVSPREIAVLFRAGFHSFAVETELNARGIKFEKRGGLKLVESAHIKDLLSLLRLSVNPLDRLSLVRVLVLIDRIGAKTADKIFARMVRSEKPIETLAEFETRASWGNDVRKLGKLISQLREMSRENAVSGLLEHAAKWYTPVLQKKYLDDYPRRNLDISQLISLARKYSDVNDMLAELALDPPDPTPRNHDSEERVILSTIHSAKGLEWKAVFIISMAEGRFPSPASTNDVNELEEERRLLYVAATRAKDLLFFCCPAFINVSGGGMMPARPCRFLESIPSSLVQLWDRVEQSGRNGSKGRACEGDGAPPVDASAPLDKPDAPADPHDPGDPFTPGTRVRHSAFGRGRIVEKLQDEKVKVLFDVGGLKTLHLKYARLSII